LNGGTAFCPLPNENGAFYEKEIMFFTKRRHIKIFIVFFAPSIVIGILFLINMYSTHTPLLSLFSVNNQDELKFIMNDMGFHLDTFNLDNRWYFFKSFYKDNELEFRIIENLATGIDIKYKSKNSIIIKSELYRIIFTGKIRNIAKNYIWVFINDNSISFQFKENSVYIIINYKFEINDFINNWDNELAVLGNYYF
jgi:hypothetical protein